MWFKIDGLGLLEIFGWVFLLGMSLSTFNNARVRTQIPYTEDATIS